MGARRSKKREIIVNAVREVAARYEPDKLVERIEEALAEHFDVELFEEQKEIYHKELVRLEDMRETAIQALGF
jgi:tRNA A37 N6-isopentenylltransferase MiaA